MASTARRKVFRHHRSFDRRKTRRSRTRLRRGRRCRRQSRPLRASRMAVPLSPPPRSLFVPASPPSAKAPPPPSRPRNSRQRQTHPREPRHRHPAGRSPFLSPRRMGPAPSSRIPRPHRLRGRRPNHPLEFSSANARLENRPRTGHGKHRHPKARRIHADHRASLRRNLPGNRSTPRRRQHRHRRRHHRRGPRRTSRRRQNRLHRLHRSRPRHPQTYPPELGGKTPFIIFEDADLDSAVEGLVDGIWFNQGQVCCAGSRLLMQESIAEPLIAKVRDRMSTLRAGAPLDKSIDIGAIVARVQLDRIKRLVDQGVAEGATCWQPQIELPSRGLYYPPTLLSNVHPTSIVAQQELFGPVLATMTFRTPSEAVELANNTVYGLAACVWKIGRA